MQPLRPGPRGGGWRGRLQDALPRGGLLDETTWNARHRGICVLLWVHAAGLMIAGLITSRSLLHAAAEASVVAWLALGAELRILNGRLRSVLATLGLLTSSAVLVHQSGGLIEAHFHFFVIVAVVALYQSWEPFLVAMAFVVLHHSITGTLAPDAVYNHSAAVTNPWWWGLMHGAFIFAESAACLVYWRASEKTLLRERAVRLAAEEAHRELAKAQALSGIGSWEWSMLPDEIVWSDQMYVLSGLVPGSMAPTLQAFLELVHPKDRERVRELVSEAYRTGGHLDYECRLVRPDGVVRTIHALGESTVDPDFGVVAMRGTCHDVTDRVRLQESMRRMANEDPLTGLANRRVFSEDLQSALETARDEGHSCALLFIDLDDFKVINDDHGHQTGDAVLEVVGDRLRRSAREGDTVARLGGDEFAVLCRRADQQVAKNAADRIRRNFRDPVVAEGARVPITASVGFAVSDRDSTPSDLLRAADAAMYLAKDSSLSTRVRRTQSLDLR